MDQQVTTMSGFPQVQVRLWQTSALIRCIATADICCKVVTMISALGTNVGSQTFYTTKADKCAAKARQIMPLFAMLLTMSRHVVTCVAARVLVVLA